jgi:hypothetical protein
MLTLIFVLNDRFVKASEKNNEKVSLYTSEPNFLLIFSIHFFKLLSLIVVLY